MENEHHKSEIDTALLHTVVESTYSVTTYVPVTVTRKGGSGTSTSGEDPTTGGLVASGKDATMFPDDASRTSAVQVIVNLSDLNANVISQNTSAGNGREMRSYIDVLVRIVPPGGGTS